MAKFLTKQYFIIHFKKCRLLYSGFLGFSENSIHKMRVHIIMLFKYKITKHINRIKKLLIFFLTFNTLSAQEIIKVYAKETGTDLNVSQKIDSIKVNEYSGQLERKIIYVKKINSSIKIDGILNEPEWEQCTPSEGFIQKEPLDNTPSTERTVVRVIIDDENICFGIQCYDSEPDKIISTEMRRDAVLDNNDNVEIFIDTYNDKKNCYHFRTNPSGARYDALIVDEGKDINWDWNAIWKCSSRKTDFGWVTEIAIPFHSIRFKVGLDRWGVNFAREIKRKNERAFWSYIPRALGEVGKFRVSLYGEMAGLKELSKGKNLEIIPYAGGSNTREYAPNISSSYFDSGFDVNYRVTGNLRADFSYNTDFAQVEADQEIVNTSRFNIFFPEKREFFLENSGLFEFGDVDLRGNRLSRQRSGRVSSTYAGGPKGYLLYYSRRIGLSEGEEIPLLGGTKASGKIGRNSIGFMSMQGKEKGLSNASIEPATNYSAIRIKRDIFNNSSIGLIGLNKQSSGEKYNRAFGIDGNFPLTTSFVTGGSFAKTITPGMKRNDYAGTFFIDLNTDSFKWYLKYLNLGDNFNPEMGFVSREKIRSTYSVATLTTWINKYGLKNFQFLSSIHYLTNNENIPEMKRFHGTTYINFSSSDQIAISVYNYHQFLSEDDDIRNILIPAGNYEYSAYYFSYKSDQGRMFSGGCTYQIGNYYGGKRRVAGPYFKFRPSQHFNMDAYYDYNHLVLPAGFLYSNVVSTRITYMFNPDMYMKAYIQWNDLDSRLSTNFLFHYIHNAANNFYLVYNENRNPDTPGIDLKDRIFMIKFVYHLFI